MRGAVHFSAGGSDHVLRFTTNRICALEESTGRRIQAFAEAIGDEATFTVGDLRTLLAFGCDISRDLAGDLVDDLSIQVAAELVGRALSLAFGAPEDATTGKPVGKRTAAAK